MTAARRRKFKNDREMLNFIKDQIVEKIENGKLKLKVGDLLKIIEIQKKLTSEKGVEDKFWEVIEEIRQKELKDD